MRLFDSPKVLRTTKKLRPIFGKQLSKRGLISLDVKVNLNLPLLLRAP